MDGMADVKASAVIENLTATLTEAISAADTYKSALRTKIDAILAPEGKVDRKAFAAHQHIAHGFAWIVTTIETLRETANWAIRLEEERASLERLKPS